MENLKRYALLLLAILGIMTIIQTTISLDYYDKNNLQDLNSALLVGLSYMFSTFGILFASTFMTPMNSKIKRIAYLVSPVSNLEKYLSRWMIITVGYILAFFAALWVSDALRVGICSAVFPDLDVKFLDLTKLMDTSGTIWPSGYLFSKHLFIFLVSLYFLFQSIFLLGSTFWEKASFIKVFAANIVIAIVFLLLCRWSILLFYESFGHFGYVSRSFGEYIDEHFTIQQGFRLASLILSAFTLFNWVIAYFRLRESEIIKRL
jgi:hypothetical protein